MVWHSDDEPDWDTDDDEEEDSEEEETDEDEEEDDDEEDDEEETDEDEEDDEEETDEDEEEESDEEDDEEEETDEEESDEEDDGFEDEPGMVAAGSNIDGGAEPGDEERGFVDEDPDKPRTEGSEKAKQVAAILCCCCIILAVVGVVLGTVVFGKDDEPAPAPKASPPSPAPVAPTPPPITIPPVAATDFPSISPAPTNPPSPAPSGVPTVTPAPSIFIPEGIEVIADGDTYITNGEDADDNRGVLEELVVFRGIDTGEGVVESFTLITFNISEIPPPTNIFERQKSAVLKLTHIPSAVDRGDVNLTVFRLESTEANIEDFTNATFPPEEGVEGPTFAVAPSDRDVFVDVSALLFGQPPFTSRATQETQFFIKIVNNGDGTESGDSFASRETTTPPELFIGLVKPTGSPTLSPKPSASPQPSLRPSLSLAPTKSPAPTVSANPTSMPSVSMAPSQSTAMSDTVLAPCDLCNGGTINIPEGVIDLSITGENLNSTCQDLNVALGSTNVSIMACDMIQEQANAVCGCSMEGGTGGSEAFVCNLCDGGIIGLPDATVDLSQLDPQGQVVTCAILGASLPTQDISEAECSALNAFVGTTCGCQSAE